MEESKCKAGANGCEWYPAICHGIPKKCTELDQAACSVLSDCRWKPEIGACSGDVAACSANTESAACRGQKGCSWIDDSTCEGTAASCSTFSVDECEEHEGCFVGTMLHP
jgi:hypothetical protein